MSFSMQAILTEINNASIDNRVTVNDTNGNFVKLLQKIENTHTDTRSTANISWLTFIANTLGHKINSNMAELTIFTPQSDASVNSIRSADYPAFAQFLRSSALFVSNPPELTGAIKSSGVIETKEPELKDTSFIDTLSQLIHQTCFISDRLDFSAANIILDSLILLFTTHKDLIPKQFLSFKTPSSLTELQEFAHHLINTMNQKWLNKSPSGIEKAESTSTPPTLDMSAAEPLLRNDTVLFGPNIHCSSNPLFIARLFEALTLRVALAGVTATENDIKIFSNALPKVNDPRTLLTIAAWLSHYDPSMSIIDYLKTKAPKNTPWPQPLTAESVFSRLEDTIISAKINDNFFPMLTRASMDKPTTPLQAILACSELYHFHESSSASTSNALSIRIPDAKVSSPTESQSGTTLDTETCIQFLRCTDIAKPSFFDQLTRECKQQIISTALQMYAQQLHEAHHDTLFDFDQLGSNLLSKPTEFSIYHPKLYLLLVLYRNKISTLATDKKFQALCNRIATSIDGKDDENPLEIFHNYAKLIAENFLFPKALIEKGVLTEDERSIYLKLLDPDLLTQNTSEKGDLQDLDACLTANKRILGHFFAILYSLPAEAENKEIPGLQLSQINRHKYYQDHPNSANLVNHYYEENQEGQKISIRRIHRRPPSSIRPPASILDILFSSLAFTKREFEEPTKMGKKVDSLLIPRLQDAYPNLEDRLLIIKAYLEFLSTDPTYIKTWAHWCRPSIHPNTYEAWTRRPHPTPNPNTAIREQVFTIKKTDDENPESIKQGLKLFLQALIHAIDAYRLENTRACSPQGARYALEFIIDYLPPAAFATAVGYLAKRLLTEPQSNTPIDQATEIGAYTAAGLTGASLARILLFSPKAFNKTLIRHIIAILEGRFDNTYTGILQGFTSAPAYTFLAIRGLPLATLTAAAGAGYSYFEGQVQALDPIVQDDNTPQGKTLEFDEIMALTLFFLMLASSGTLLSALWTMVLMLYEVLPPCPSLFCASRTPPAITELASPLNIVRVMTPLSRSGSSHRSSVFGAETQTPRSFASDDDEYFNEGIILRR